MAPSSRAPPYRGPERRAAPRFRLQGPVSFHSGDVGGSGRVRNISTRGAFIEAGSARLVAGTRCWLALLIDISRPQVHVTATVVRDAEDGFAVEFTERHERLKCALDLALCAVGRGVLDDEDETKPLVES